MDIKICKDERQWTLEAVHWLEESLTQYKPKKVFLPAGNTPIPLYRAIEQNPLKGLQGVRLLQVDEILTGPKAGEFRKFFESHLPSFTNQFEWIEEGGSIAEVSVLGLGLNGHVAFHEPGLPANFSAGCMQLTPTTCEVLGVKSPTWAVSYGADVFMKSKAILMLVRGEAKRGILQQALQPGSTLPAAQVFKHPNVTLLTDFQF